jgi:hypothetical protein
MFAPGGERSPLGVKVRSQGRIHVPKTGLVYFLLGKKIR